MKRKAQVTVYIFSAIATLVIISFVIINIGKTAKDKTHADNAADAGALAACSVMATGFNYLTDSQSKQKDTSARYDSDQGIGTQPSSTSNQFENVGEKPRYKAAEGINTGISSGFGEASAQAGEQGTFIDQLMKDLQTDLEKFAKEMKEYAQKMWKKISDSMAALDDADNPAAQDYQNTAISAGYKICFQNSGTHHRLGKINSKRYEAFQKSLEPGMVQSGMPMTFFWVDGAARAHMVTCIINVEPADSASEQVAQDDSPTSQGKMSKEQGELTSATGAAQTSKGGFILAMVPCFYIIGELIGIAGNATASNFRESGDTTNTDTHNGLEQNKKVQKRGRASDSKEMVKNIDDVNNSRMVSAANFQFHMGSPIKSINADIDMVTFYPPVQSTAIASFNYTGQGQVSDHSTEGGGQSARHECGLVGAF